MTLDQVKSHVSEIQEQVGGIKDLKVFSASPYVAVKQPHSAAAQLGFSTFDEIASINHQTVNFFRQIDPLLKKV